MENGEWKMENGEATESGTSVLGGVIEGFYGRPWTLEQRRLLFEWMRDWKLNAYLYAPKDDLKHRACWRSLYSSEELLELSQVSQFAREASVSVIYGIAPGLDIEFGGASDERRLKDKLRQLRDIGVDRFALLFDDIPDALSPGDARKFGTAALAQCDLMERILKAFEAENGSSQFYFCPTPYCGRMAGAPVSSCEYLRQIGERLPLEVDVFWTGPEIVSETIPVASIVEVKEVLRRPPVIWDNLHANDYDMRRIYLGPYEGRTAALKQHIKGLFSNPNCEFWLNYVPLRTMADFIRCSGSWNSSESHRRALEEYRRYFEVASDDAAPGGSPPLVRLEQLEWLADLFYLPHAHGRRVGRLLDLMDRVFAVEEPNNNELKEELESACRSVAGLLPSLTFLRNRDLLHSLYRHAWDAREEMELILEYSRWRSDRSHGEKAFYSRQLLPGTFRGGFVESLRRKLPMEESGEVRFRE